MNHPFRLLPRGSLHERDGLAVGELGKLTLHSVYQPIISPALLRVVGMEAQLRVDRAGLPLATDTLSNQVPRDDITAIDRIALALHSINMPLAQTGNEWVFLPLHPETIRQRDFTAHDALIQLSALNVSPERIVLEVTDNAGLSDQDMASFVAEFRAEGFRIAISDFGAGASNLDRVLAVHPDIVRLDRSLIQNAEQSPRARRLFPHMVSLLRESGSLVLVNGIASEAQAQIALDADAELLQGDWFAPAARELADPEAIRKKAEALLGVANAMTPPRNEIRMRGRFMTVWNAYRDGRELEDIVAEITEEQVTRVYVIDSRGYQIGDTVLTPHALRGNKHPLSDSRGACWSRRQYFRKALEQPGRVQITRPYLSLTEQRLCTTISCVVMRPGLGQVVLCMDALLGD